MKDKAILLIHGFGGSPNDFGKIINDLSSDYDIFSFILPGHKKKKVRKVKKEEWINKAELELRNIIDKNYNSIYIIGHSMGAVIAVYLASKYKEIDKIVLASPAYKYQEKEDFTFKEGIQILKSYSFSKVLSKIFNISKRAFNEFSHLVIEHKDDIKMISIPTLIIWGTEDKIVSKDNIDYVYNNMSSKSLLLFNIEGVTHSIFINERYQEIKNIILDFLINDYVDIKKETSI